MRVLMKSNQALQILECVSWQAVRKKKVKLNMMGNMRQSIQEWTK